MIPLKPTKQEKIRIGTAMIKRGLELLLEAIHDPT